MKPGLVRRVFVLLGSLAAISCRGSRLEASRLEAHAVRLERLAGRSVGALRVESAFALPAGLYCDFYGARQTGPYLALGIGHGPPSGRAPVPAREVEAARTATHELGIIDVRAGTMRLLRAVNEGWTTTAISGAGGWLLTRERHAEAPSACGGTADCWSWALYAYHLPEPAPRLLSRSGRPESQAHAPEPAVEQGVFAWLEGTGPASDLVVKRWMPEEGSPRTLASVAASTASPILSISGGNVWLDERRPDAAPPRLRRVRLDGVHQPAIELRQLAFFPVVSDELVAFVTEDPSPKAPDAFVRRSVQVARIDQATRTVTSARRLTSAPDVWDLAWLDGTHLVSAGAEGVEVLDVTAANPRIARITTVLVTAARTGDNHVVVVSSDRSGQDVLQSLRL